MVVAVAAQKSIVRNNKKGNYLVGGIIAIILGILIIGGMPTDNNYVSNNNSANILESVTNKDDGQKVESKVDSELKISYIILESL